MLPELPKFIADNIEHFTGRTWLLSPLLLWWSQTSDRMFVLTGPPGSGKSTIVAWLAGAGPSPTDVGAKQQLVQFRSAVGATHFCSSDSRGSIDPRTFTQGMTKQLVRNVEGFRAALLASLPNSIGIQIKQQVERVEPGGNVVGVLIENLTLHLDTLSDEASFNRGLRDPLKQLYQDGYNESIILLVDALDEAATYTGNTDIVQLLARIDDLPQKVRILATTRPDPPVLKNYRGAKHLDLIEDVPDNVDDVAIYASNRLSILDMISRLRLVERISNAAEGNFLYTHLVLEDLLTQMPIVVDPETFPLPKGLSGVYRQFLNRKWGKDERSWFETYGPLLGLIAIAEGEGFSLAQINSIVGKDSGGALRVISQYLKSKLPQGPFRLFHRSFEEFLLDDEENIDYHIDASSMHCLIAKYYRNRYQERWEQLDDYGIKFLLRHLLACDKENELEGLSSDEYAKRHLFYHMKAANLHDVIGEVVNLICE